MHRNRVEVLMKKKGTSRLRLYVQIIYTILTNGYVYGYMSGKIYKGNLKYVCVPGLNCYSCPGAVGSCPMGAGRKAQCRGDPEYRRPAPKGRLPAGI